MKNNCANIETICLESELWDVYKGAYGNVIEDLKELLNLNQEIPEHEKSLNVDSQSSYMIALDNMHQQLCHQLSFYDALYLVLPHMTRIYQYWSEQNDFKMQIMFLTIAGTALATDISYNHYCNNDRDDVPEKIMENYQKSILFFEKEVKDIFRNNLDKLKEYYDDDLPYICAAFLAFLGKREEAYIFLIGNWSQCMPFCKVCEYLDDIMELDYDMEDNIEELNAVITPADSVIGQWDNKSFDNTYIFLSNVMHLLGKEKDVKKLQYFYGTFRCPECGNIDGPVMELAKLAFKQE